MNHQHRFYTIAQIIFVLAVLLALYLTKEVITTVLFSFFLAYLLDPIYIRILSLTRQRQISSFLALMVLFAAFILILLIIIDVLMTETTSLLSSGQAISTRVSLVSGDLATFADRYLPSSAAGYIGALPFRVYSWGIEFLAERISAFAINLPDIIARLILAVFITYYILADGRRLLFRAMQISPEKTIVRRFLKELNAIYTTLFQLFFVTSAITGTIAATGFYVLGIPYPLLWGTLVGVFELIPFLGSAGVVWPMVVYFFISRQYTTAIALSAFGFIFLTVIPENVIRPRLAERGAKIHPVLTILAFTAPLFVIGLPGVILGPAVYGFVLAGYRTYTYLRTL